MGKSGLIWVLCAGALAVSCSTPAPPPAQPVAQTVSPNTPVQSPVWDGRPVGSRLPSPDADACGAEALQGLVGQPRTEIPVPVNVVARRVTCTTCPMTEDHSPFRLNILYDRETGIIEQVRCG